MTKKSKRSNTERPVGNTPIGSIPDEGISRLLALVSSYLTTCSTFSPAEKSTVLGQLRARHISKLLETVASLPTEYSELPRFREVTQLEALIKKYPFTPQESAMDPELTAIRTFKSTERRVARVNTCVRMHTGGVRPNPARRPDARPKVAFTLNAIRRKILHVIGVAPNMARIYEQCDFTSGAAIGVSGTLTNWGRKASAKEFSCSRSCYPYASAALASNVHLRNLIGCGASLPLGEADWQDADSLVTSEQFRTALAERVTWVDHNNIAFVPKTAKTHRSIAVEPLLNGFVQNGIGLELKSLLRRIGIDLSDQGPNQQAAREGSLQGVLDPWVTIDLSAASDSISTELCRSVLPEQWYRLLDDCRVHAYTLGGRRETYSKFVSMGNGFCFPLQTLLFSAVAMTVIEECSPLECPRPRAPRDFLVYGDDIVVRQSVALRVLEVLSRLGFKANRDKTFIVGPFRESCGADWVNGQPVRAVYLKHRMTSATEIYAFHNVARSISCGEGRFGITPEFLRAIRDFVPSKWRFLRPFTGPDSAFEVGLDEAMTCDHVRWSRRKQAWRWRELRTKPVPDLGLDIPLAFWEDVGYLASLRASSAGEKLAVRRKTRAQLVDVTNWGLGCKSETQDRIDRLLGC